ncbi:WhiB family transcriptional regulator [Parafrankia discariae]|uniref:WhiB family transcriptional regulator n=1 Tax=Parafrankia discariae TaxID=365528 RepID=UPI00036D4F6B|nr:WhiB family transcriptional regulator [Parafrankia discariae]
MVGADSAEDGPYWQARGACLEYPTEWWEDADVAVSEVLPGRKGQRALGERAENRRRQTLALAVCAGCAVELECLVERAAAEPPSARSGTFGGMTHTQRSRRGAVAARVAELRAAREDRG